MNELIAFLIVMLVIVALFGLKIAFTVVEFKGWKRGFDRASDICEKHHGRKSRTRRERT